MSTANANPTWQASNGNVVGNTVQFDWRGGTATYVINVTDGSTISVVVDNTIANCIGTCIPTPDEWRVSINNETFYGNTIGVFTVSAVASGQVVVSVYGKDIGFWGGWYGPIFQAPTVTSPVIIVDTPTAIVETQTPQVVETPTVTVPDTPTVVPESPTVIVDSPTVVVSDTSVVIVEVPTSLETLTSSETLTHVETTTPVVETGTVPVESLPLPTPVPVVEPQPVPQPVAPAPQPTPEPPTPVQAPEIQPEPQPQPEPEPLPEVINEEAPLEEQPLEEQPVVEEQPPVEEPSEHLVEEDTHEIPVEEPEILEPLESTPEPLTPTVVVPEPVIQPDVAYVPPSNNGATVTLDNGVVLTEEEAVAIVLLQNPGELLTELFTDPGAVLTALGSVGADMTPEAREKSEKVVVSAIIAGGIATQTAASVAGAAAYRRKP